MAKTPKGIHFTGTVGNICFYQWGDRTFARAKSSLTRKRVLKSKEFASTRKYASDMGNASRIASGIYRALPSDVKGRWLFRAIAGEAASLIYKGKEEKEVKDILWNKYILDIDCANTKIIRPNSNKEAMKVSCLNTAPSSKQVNRQLQSIFLERWEKQGKPAYYFKRAWKQGSSFNPETIPRRSEYFLGVRHASRVV